MNDSRKPTGTSRSVRHRSAIATLLLLCAALASFQAGAVPSFSRQTGIACSGCHVGGFGPQLTSLGRQFKLDGYTMGSGDNVPLSVMDVESFTRTRKDQPENAGPYDGTNNNGSLQQLSLFVAGRLAEHLGTFTQVTYSDIDRHVAMDNMDVRYARPVTWGKHSGTFGISVNNNPGAQDVWNTSPAWRFPFMASGLAPGPAAATLLEGGLGQQVIGATAYAFLDSKYYGELGFYRTLPSSLLRSLNVDDGGSLSGLTPYCRFAYTMDGKGQTLTLDLTGLDARLHPDRLPGPSDHYRDIELDASYQYLGGSHYVIAIDADAIHETQRRTATFLAGDAAQANGHVDTFNLNASYYYDAHDGVTLGYFDSRGDRDAVLFGPNPGDGSRTGKPDGSGVVMQADWTPFGQSDSWHSPWINLRLGIQYTAYSKFNGASHDYDGFGRNARDNDTLFVFLWNAF